MNIVVTGADGQLGSEIKDISLKYSNNSFHFYDLPELDITDQRSIENIVDKHTIDLIINCAAYTAVDNAEDNKELAYAVNATGVERLVEIAEKINSKLIHISTDYVFDGTQHTPYCESDPAAPIGVYGKTKYAGEQAIFNSDSDSIVIRTSWLYSSHGNNFVKTMIRLGNNKDSLGVIFDQIGSPTYAADLATTICHIADNYSKISAKGKLYHFSNEGVASWFDFTKAIHSIAGISCKVNPIETKYFPTKAVRPYFSILNKAKIKSDFNIEIPYWKESLEKCIKKLQSPTYE